MKAKGMMKQGHFFSPFKYVNKNSGFTLVEVLMAMIILMFGILAVASMQIMAMKGNLHARNTTGRTTAAQYYIEQLMASNFTDANLDITSSPFGPVTTNLPEQITSLSWTVECGSYVDSSGNNTCDAGEETSKIITVTVNWEDGGSTSIKNEKPNL